MSRSVWTSLALVLLLCTSASAQPAAHPPALPGPEPTPGSTASAADAGGAPSDPGAGASGTAVASGDPGPADAGTAAAGSPVLHEHGSATGYETTIEASAPTSAASAESIRDRDLRLRPASSAEDLLRVVPGLVIAQHQGGGKADQLFLRGFDADHGTDVALSVDGIPVNLPSHAHGQGYADLNFLIPEVIDRVDVLKGPYFVEVGDFATAARSTSAPGAASPRARSRAPTARSTPGGSSASAAPGTRPARPGWRPRSTGRRGRSRPGRT